MNNNSSSFVNLTCNGIGFLNRPRVVNVKKSSEYYAATIMAAHGDSNDKTRFEVRIVGTEAKEIFAKLLQEYPALLSDDFKQRPTVSVGFRVADLQASTFTSKDGKEIPYIDARLLKFSFIKVNKTQFYPASETSDATADEESTDAVAA